MVRKHKHKPKTRSKAVVQHITESILTRMKNRNLPVMQRLIARGSTHTAKSRQSVVGKPGRDSRTKKKK